MTDYRKLPLGPLGIGRIGDIVECPICKEHALEVEDYKNPTSGSREKETVYVHFDVPLPIRLIEENKKSVGEYETGVNACRIGTKPLPRPMHPGETPHE